MSLEQVANFYEQVANDADFQAKIQSVNSKDECSQIVKDAGYDFTQEEFEEYTSQLLEAKANEDELQDLSKEELVAVIGGLAFRLTPRPLYGVVIPPI
ncbi:Nif11-like leader peptide family natural product precursor [Nodularia spumigena CS-591/12]|uniref:Nif11-like leader peptide family natural product precursor n=1 Tax=Nodularia spumigena TaxID=70799 RepID=UPI00232B2512|nr:Nif11-like leader peptide family natural product precursor [Nodularia spumigena]MDB9305031.1 Nif11-like leader peptide family natural product precursor [Nodularia spumigena CS-591/12]MDB9343167.1 Nif11-like leader peptide family natural product precursor [Nodularia spumigena CS-588/06]MDB9370899.1 Nif11-like leader peptide family natural product precursor [Nodularia spumigena CS-586/05]